MPGPSGDPTDPMGHESSKIGEETGETKPLGDQPTDLADGPATRLSSAERTRDLNPDDTGEWRPEAVEKPAKRRADGYASTEPADKEDSNPSAGVILQDIGDYELLSLLGKGGMGVVYRARQASLNRIVALKLNRPSGPPNEVEARRFQQEAEAVASLDHPSIVPIYEVGVHEGHHYFSMKLISGESLQQAMSRLRGKFPAIGRILATSARAVQHAHERGHPPSRPQAGEYPA